MAILPIGKWDTSLEYLLIMNIKLVESLIHVILSLSEEERSLLEEKLFFDSSYPSTHDIMEFAQINKAFNFLYDEPDLYTLEDGEAI
ncbi:MAG: hypothetical protein RMX68_006645 [Aulosira sp. ZfuVER01]|nr:hypothetical protein [Aulosira sp. ZfuVER01]MDZ8001597.1 hypothetical protein [Aulosira sp. DedVER01a]MDZ8051535.1 hypothetical protein [Aulosira sp. ZfuCHP01]